MSSNDRIRWNQRYRDADRGWYDSPRALLLENADSLPANGWALDVAMGMGANARFLSDRGLKVIGLDASEVAVRYAKKASPALAAAIMDLDHVHLAAGRLDLIVNLYFLNRALFTLYPMWLKPGGILVIECLTLDMLDVRPDLDPQRLLHPGELYQTFGRWDILFHREGWMLSEHGHQKAVESLIARHPGPEVKHV